MLKDDLEAEAVMDRFAETMFRLMMEHHQRQAVEMEMTLPQAQALRLLLGGPRSTGDLAAALRISAPAVTQLTNRLTRKQLIERQAADGDRRSVLIALSERGRQAVESFRERRNTVFSGALALIESSDRMEIVLALAKLAAALEQMNAPAAQSASENHQMIVRLEHENEAEITHDKRQTPPERVDASKLVNQGKTGNASRRVRIEWD